jgi:hypothetical protein
VAGLCIVSTGCAVCASPYDDCSPTFLGGCDENCVTDDRAGSIITGYEGEYVGETSTVPTPPASPDDTGEEVPLPSPVPDPSFDGPNTEFQPTPQTYYEPEPTYRATPSAAVHQGHYSNTPMTMRPQRSRMR